MDILHMRKRKLFLHQTVCPRMTVLTAKKCLEFSTGLVWEGTCDLSTETQCTQHSQEVRELITAGFSVTII